MKNVTVKKNRNKKDI